MKLAKTITADASGPVALEVSTLNAYYGKSHVLHGVTMTVPTNQVTCIYGRNGAGKTTLLGAISGLVEKKTGSVKLAGRELIGQSQWSIARRGLALVPQGRWIFGGLTVEENLRVAGGMRLRGTDPALDQVWQMFPDLAQKRAQPGRFLSGGQQQMLAIGRAIVRKPSILLLDEPTQGLAPQIVGSVLATIGRLRDEGLTIVLVEQSLEATAPYADHVVVLVEGRSAFAGSYPDLIADPQRVRTHLGVGISNTTPQQTTNNQPPQQPPQKTAKAGRDHAV